MFDTSPLLTRGVLLAVLGFGGYFLGGIASNVASGESIGRMFAGTARERAIQLLIAAVVVAVGWGVLAP